MRDGVTYALSGETIRLLDPLGEVRKYPRAETRIFPLRSPPIPTAICSKTSANLRSDGIRRGVDHAAVLADSIVEAGETGYLAAICERRHRALV